MQSTVLLLLLAPACIREEWRNADLQLDIEGAVPGNAHEVRICIANQGERTVGASGTRFAVPGLLEGEAASITVDVLAEAASAPGTVLSRAGPVALDAATGWRQAAQTVYTDTTDTADTAATVPAPDPCTASGGFAPTEDASWLLAVRFLG